MYYLYVIGIKHVRIDSYINNTAYMLKYTCMVYVSLWLKYMVLLVMNNRYDRAICILYAVSWWPP